jgi:hypothetical protein
MWKPIICFRFQLEIVDKLRVSNEKHVEESRNSLEERLRSASEQREEHLRKQLERLKEHVSLLAKSRICSAYSHNLVYCTGLVGVFVAVKFV